MRRIKTGLFENLRWTPFLTFLLAVFTHTNMLVYLLVKGKARLE
jgi:hypothetical protein